MSKKRLIPNIVRGGGAIPIPNKTNYYYMKGRKHKDGGIDIGENPRTGLEVEDGEVLHLTDNNIKVYSSVPFLNGQSPAEKVLNGENPDKVFKQQEDFKDRNKINDDGTKKAKMGIEEENNDDFIGPPQPLKLKSIKFTPSREKINTIIDSYNLGDPSIMVYKDTDNNMFYIHKNDKNRAEQEKLSFVNTDELLKIRKQLDYIGGDEKQSSINVFKRLPKTLNTIDSLANIYGVNKNNILERLAQEGVTSELIKRYNDATLSEQKDKNYLDNLLLTEDLSGNDAYNIFGLDTAGEHLEKGHFDMKWKDKNMWYEISNIINEKGESQTSVVTPNNKVNLEIMTAHIKYLQDKMKKKFPNASEQTIINLINAAFNRGEYHSSLKDTNLVNSKYAVTNWDNELNKKAMGGDNKIDPRHAKLIARRGMPGDIEALRAAGYDKYGNPLVTFNGGNFGGGGAGMEFDSEPVIKENTDYVRNTPILKSFSDAFAEAKRNNKSTFIFNGKKFTTEVSGNPNYIGKRYEPTLNIREVLDENKKVISDSTRVEPYVGQIPGTHKRIKKSMGGTTNKPVTVTVNGKTKVVYSPSTGKSRSEAEGDRIKGELGLIQPITKYNNLLERPLEGGIKSRIVPKHLSYNAPRLPLVTIPKVNNRIDMTQPVISKTSPINPVGSQRPIETKSTGLIGNVLDFIKENKNLVNDGVSLVGNVTGSLLSNRANRKMLNELKFGPAPTPRTATKLKTNININPQLDKMRETLAAYERNVDSNTASSRVALARKNRAATDILSQRNMAYMNKENQETQLINQDRLNRQNITNQNIADYNNYLTNKANFENAIIEKKAENKVNLINNLNSAIQNVITTGEKRRKDRNTLLAIIAANPNVNPQMLKDLGFDGITQNTIDRINKNRRG